MRIKDKIIKLLKDIKEKLNINILFIRNDLKVVRKMCDKIDGIKDGKLCEV